ncbi:Methyl-CpG-binding domain protein 2 [Intoshia linei]|uniref:Methyl-CpG-binding domain protein 2 n=1 Tax=Intoshia linei TaxID=1819745 RepID=A0A177B7A6_9BILA|nr:Methyl-CpG-binding domain protein 2 [Intoshia linei]
MDVKTGIFNINSLPKDWKKKVELKYGGILRCTKIVEYVSPTGHICKNKAELAHELGELIDLSNFDYDTGTYRLSRNRKKNNIDKIKRNENYDVSVDFPSRRHAMKFDNSKSNGITQNQQLRPRQMYWNRRLNIKDNDVPPCIKQNKNVPNSIQSIVAGLEEQQYLPNLPLSQYGSIDDDQSLIHNIHVTNQDITDQVEKISNKRNQLIDFIKNKNIYCGGYFSLWKNKIHDYVAQYANNGNTLVNFGEDDDDKINLGNVNNEADNNPEEVDNWCGDLNLNLDDTPCIDAKYGIDSIYSLRRILKDLNIINEVMVPSQGARCRIDIPTDLKICYTRYEPLQLISIMKTYKELNNSQKPYQNNNYYKKKVRLVENKNLRENVKLSTNSDEVIVNCIIDTGTQDNLIKSDVFDTKPGLTHNINHEIPIIEGSKHPVAKNYPTPKHLQQAEHN